MDQAPPEELAAVAQLQANHDRSHDISPVEYFFIIAVPMVVIGMFAYFVFHQHRRRRQKEGEFVGNHGGDLEAQNTSENVESFVKVGEGPPCTWRQLHLLGRCRNRHFASFESRTPTQGWGTVRCSDLLDRSGPLRG